MKMKKMNSVDFFEEWFNTIGVRTYSRNHGNADGHRVYLSMAFLAGWYAHDRNEDTIKELREENRRLKDEINCRLT